MSANQVVVCREQLTFFIGTESISASHSGVTCSALVIALRIVVSLSLCTGAARFRQLLLPLLAQEDALELLQDLIGQARLREGRFQHPGWRGCPE